MNSPEIDEVLRKIGRNVLMLQRIEAMLKHIIPRSHIEGDLNTLNNKHEKSIASLSQLTMGNLIKRFVETILKEGGLENEGIESKSAFSFKFQVEMSKECIEAKKAALECIVLERNNLIHHMLSNFNQNSIDSCLELGKRLDEQNELIRIEFEYLRSLLLSFNECSKVAFQYLEHEFINKSRDSGKRED